MRKEIIGALLLATMLFMYACGDSSSPEVTITAPAANSTFMAGDTIVINGIAMDDIEVSTLAVQSATTGLALSGFIDIANVPDKSNFNFAANINLDLLLQAGDYQIDVIATDDDGNTGSDFIEFSVQ